MFFSSWEADENCRLLSSVGLEILIGDVVTVQEPQGRATFQWVPAKRAP